MNNLNFATYARAIEKGMTKTTQVELTQLLLNFILEENEVLNKKGQPYDINDSYASLWLNKDMAVPKNIKTAAQSPKIISKAYDYFEEEVLNALSPQKENDAYSSLIELINSDEDISNNNKDDLISLYEDNNIGRFLAETFLYAIQKEGKKIDNKNKSTLSSLEKDINQINELFSKLPKPTIIEPKEILEDHELKYTSELFAAYADAKGLSQITRNDLKKYPKYEKNFERQRKDYYAA